MKTANSATLHRSIALGIVTALALSSFASPARSCSWADDDYYACAEREDELERREQEAKRRHDEIIDRLEDLERGDEPRGGGDLFKPRCINHTLPNGYYCNP